jgi:hypothetical protein
MLDFSRYISDRTVNFTGRAWVFEKISEWLSLSAGSPGGGRGPERLL